VPHGKGFTPFTVGCSTSSPACRQIVSTNDNLADDLSSIGLASRQWRHRNEGEAIQTDSEVVNAISANTARTARSPSRCWWRLMNLQTVNGYLGLEKGSF
jgi:hypothetical protein